MVVPLNSPQPVYDLPPLYDIPDEFEDRPVEDNHLVRFGRSCGDRYLTLINLARAEYRKNRPSANP